MIITKIAMFPRSANRGLYRKYLEACQKLGRKKNALKESEVFGFTDILSYRFMAVSAREKEQEGKYCFSCLTRKSLTQ